MSDKGQTRRTILLDAWRSVFERVNRIVSGGDVTVKVATELSGSGMEEIPAWTDGTVITFNGPAVAEMIGQSDPVAAVLKLKGLNYHELSHVLYTPRRNDGLVTSIRKRGERDRNLDSLWWAFNALEDQRIETTFSTVFGPSRRYFEATSLHYLITKGTVESAILIHGRKYIDPKVRVRARAAFEAKYPGDLYTRFAKVIDAYLLVELPTAAIAAEQLIVKFAELMREMQQQGGQAPALPIDDHKAVGHGDMSGGKPVKQSASERREQTRAVKAVIEKAAKDDAKAKAEAEKAKADAKAKAEEDAKSKSDKGDDKADDGTESGQDDAGGDTGQSSDGAGEDGGDSSSDSDGDGAEGDSSSSAAGTSGTGDHGGGDTLKDAIRDMVEAAEAGLDDIHQDEDILEDVDNMLDAVKAAENNGNYEAQGMEVNNLQHRGATSEEQFTVRKVVGKIAQIKAKAEPEIMRAQANGRVDVRRALTRANTDVDIFTRYDEGSLDETGMEVVLLMDVSGSMSYSMGAANQAMWTLKRAFDRQDIPCTVILYESEHHVLYRARQKVGASIPQVQSMGGTTPEPALREALTILSKSNEPNKVLVTITDGQWAIAQDTEASIMRAFNVMGTHTMLIGLQEAVKRYGKHRHQIGIDLESVSHLPKVTTKLVEQIMRSAVGIA